MPLNAKKSLSPRELERRALEGTVVAITGAGRGFGHAIARAFGNSGASVIVVDADANAATIVASELEANGTTAIPIKGDLSITLEVTTLFEKMLEIYGSISGIVHVVDRGSVTAFRRISEAEWSELFVQVRSSMQILQQLERKVKHAWSTLVLPPTDIETPQTQALRNALIGLVKGLALEHTGGEMGRIHALLPNRPSSGADFDAAIGQAALGLALPHSVGLNGAVLKVELEPIPTQLPVMPELEEFTLGRSE